MQTFSESGPKSFFTKQSASAAARPNAQRHEDAQKLPVKPRRLLRPSDAWLSVSAGCHCNAATDIWNVEPEPRGASRLLAKWLWDEAAGFPPRIKARAAMASLGLEDSWAPANVSDCVCWPCRRQVVAVKSGSLKKQTKQWSLNSVQLQIWRRAEAFPGKTLLCGSVSTFVLKESGAPTAVVPSGACRRRRTDGPT